MNSCCVILFTILPSFAFMILGIVAVAGFGLCSSSEGWILAVYLAVTFVYAINIEVSFIKIERPIKVWLPSLWGNCRWLNCLCWLAYLGSFGYFLWFHHWPGLRNESPCLAGQGNLGFVAVCGMVGTGLLHLCAVILWKMCRKRRVVVRQHLADEGFGERLADCDFGQGLANGDFGQGLVDSDSLVDYEDLGNAKDGQSLKRSLLPTIYPRPQGSINPPTTTRF